MNILGRIDFALNNPKILVEAEAELPDKVGPAMIVDMDDQIAKMRALKNCKGPCVGWDDYAAGKDYRPPMLFRVGSTRPYGPKDTGRTGITSPKEGEHISLEPNPFSVKYGGVRPWARGEVLMTMMYSSDDEEARGTLYAVAKKGVIERAARATHGKYDETDIEDAVMRGASAVLLELPNDEVRDGVRFTNFVGSAIQQAMKAGVPAGYGNEYRKARGFKRTLTPLIKTALNHVMNGLPLEGDIEAIDREFEKIAICPRCKGTGEVVNPRDKNVKMVCPRCDGKKTTEPGPKSEYGNVASKLYEIQDELHRAITSEDESAVRRAIDIADKKFDEIAEDEETFSTPGITTQGAVGKKSREQGTLIAFNKAAKLLKWQRDLAQDTINKLKKGEAVEVEKLLEASKDLVTKFRKTTSKSWAKKKAVKEAEEKDEDKKRGYVSPYEQKQEDLPGSKGFIGLAAIKRMLDAALQSRDISKLEEFIKMSDEEQAALRIREEVNARSITATGLTTRSDTGKETERMNFAHPGRKGDYLRSAANQEIMQKALTRVSPYQDSSSEQKKNSIEAAAILAAINNALNEYMEAESEDVDTTKAKRDLIAISRDIDSSLGEWESELTQLLDQILGAIRIGSGFSGAQQEIADLRQIAKQNKKIRSPEDVMSIQQYRLLLRLYGIDNYPERGTPEDPEIDERGELSRWAEAGYPAVTGSQPSDIHIWTDVFDTVDEDGRHVPSTSSANISHQKNRANAKFTAVAKRIKEVMGESFGVDSVEYKMVAEFHQLLCQMVVEDAVPGATKMIYG
jgi:hypothetical protein